MSDVERDGDEFVVDLTLLATAFGRPAEDVRTRMRTGQIASTCEAGQDADEGRWRLTFRDEDRALRLIVDRDGAILGKSSFPVGRRDAAGRPQARQSGCLVAQFRKSRQR